MAKVLENVTEGDFIPKLPPVIPIGDEDSERAWDKWIDDLRSAESGGRIRAYKLPVDTEGNPLSNAKGSRQEMLGHWPHDQFGYEELIDKIRNDHMSPGEVWHVRFQGTVNGSKGNIFNQIVTIRKAKNSLALETQDSNVGSLYKIVQEGQQQTLRLLQSMTPQPSPQPAINWTGIQQIAAIAVPAVTGIITALISRPRQASDIGSMVSALRELKGIANGDSEEGSDDSTVGVIKAVAPAATELLKVLGSLASSPQRRVPVVAQQRPPQIKPVQHSLPEHMTRPPASTETNSPQIAPTQSESAKTQESNIANQPAGGDMLKQLKENMEFLAENFATNDSDPNDAAKLIASMIPEQAMETFCDLVGNPEKFSTLKFLSKKIDKHWDWFLKVRDALENMLFEDGEQS